MASRHGKQIAERLIGNNERADCRSAGSKSGPERSSVFRWTVRVRQDEISPSVTEVFRCLLPKWRKTGLDA
jgi:hypothetical protein